jgi:hypothetical protein
LLSVCIACSGEAPPEGLAGESIFRDVEKYVEFGIHRSGTLGDNGTANWLAERLRSAGMDVHLQEWTFSQFHLDECAIEVGGTEISCFPFWLPRETGEDGVCAPVVRFHEGTDAKEVQGRIAYLESNTVGGNHFKLGVRDDVLASGAVGTVYVVGSPTGELVAQNAVPPFTRQPLPIPAVIAAQRDEEVLRSAVADGEDVCLRVEGAWDHSATAFNVVGRLERGKRWIVVSTPISGWFECGGERGPGVALWLAIAKWAAMRSSDTSFLFVGTSGHELDNMGAHFFSDSESAPKPDQVMCWLHLGASIGTRQWEQADGGWRPLPARSPGNLVGSPELLPILESAFEDVGALDPRSGESKGELRVVFERGYRGFGFFGGHPWFHTPRDVAGSTEAAFLEPIAHACVTALDGIERSFTDR